MVKENGMVMMSEEEFKKYSDTDKLRKLLFKVIKERPNGDVKVTRREFLDIYDIALEMIDSEFGERTEIYGHNVEVHWHGIYCDCGDGATAYNYIVDEINGVIEELDDEDDEEIAEKETVKKEETKNINKEVSTEKLKKLIHHINELEHIWGDIEDSYDEAVNENDEVYDEFCNKYPFEKSFDTYLLPIMEWRYSLENYLKEVEK